MNSNTVIEKKGKELAATWLTEHHYDILHRNWRHRRFGIDVIAKKECGSAFHRSGDLRTIRFSFPEQKVDSGKIENILQRADKFLKDFEDVDRVQYDVLSVSIYNGNPYFFIMEDVYL